MSTLDDRRRILAVLHQAGGWVHRYGLRDHPALAHLRYMALTQDLAWLRKRGLVEMRRSPIPSENNPCYPTHDYRLAPGRQVDELGDPPPIPTRPAPVVSVVPAPDARCPFHALRPALSPLHGFRLCTNCRPILTRLARQVRFSPGYRPDAGTLRWRMVLELDATVLRGWAFYGDALLTLRAELVAEQLAVA